MAESDIRQTAMLHEDLALELDDAWHLGDYGDGWGLWAIKTDDPHLDEVQKSAAERRSWLDKRLRGL